ncbi:MAG: RpiB/LacA/LacB family sugar-phosphate isomerase [Erysipelothrix sp.]|nr:RpiB/LacA/LacB family sugar-phosphate isomerase [Erysipelothrix sp.]
MKKISMGSDHAAFEFKGKAIKYLEAKGYEVEDFGPFTEGAVDYPDFVYPAVKNVVDHDDTIGIVMCGSGIGANIVANKVVGARAALVYDPEIAKTTREHNDSNVLVLGPRFTSEENLYAIIDNFLNTEFSNDERHIKRIEKIKGVEANER